MHSPDGVDAAAVDVTTVLLIAESLQKQQFCPAEAGPFRLFRFSRRHAGPPRAARGRARRLVLLRRDAGAASASDQAPARKGGAAAAASEGGGSEQGAGLGAHVAARDHNGDRAIARLKEKYVRGAEPNDPPK